MITTITALLASSVFVWSFIIGTIITMIVLLEYEKQGWATTFFSLGIALILWNYKTEILNYLTTNPTNIVIFFVSYVIIGVIWSFIKWNDYVKSIFRKAQEIKDDFVHTYGEINDETKKQFISKINSSSLRDGYYGHELNLPKDTSFEKIAKEIAPIASRKKATITSWVSYWPISLLGTMLNNPFKKFFEWIYNSISKFYDKIVTSHQKNAFK